MARKAARPVAGVEKRLQPLRERCPECRGRMWADYENYRTITMLDGAVRLRLKIRRHGSEHATVRRENVASLSAAKFAASIILGVVIPGSPKWTFTLALPLPSCQPLLPA